jgi:excisionase family DNA binding protein
MCLLNLRERFIPTVEMMPMKKNSDSDELLTTDKVAEELKVTADRIRQLVRAGRLPYSMKVGRNYLIRRGDIELVRVRKVGKPKQKENL